MRDQLRRQFRSEYLEKLRQHSVTNFQVKSLQIEEIVLLDNANKKRDFWNLASVELRWTNKDLPV